VCSSDLVGLAAIPSLFIGAVLTATSIAVSTRLLIDLGLGRAPGTDQATAHALRHKFDGDVNAFPRDVVELQKYFRAVEPGQRIRAVPGAGLNVPLWILGSSLFGAQLAAALGLPYAFASHFAPAALMQAIDVYRDNFQPSEQLSKPHVMVGFSVFAADTEEEAIFQRSSSAQSILALRRGAPDTMPPPLRKFDEGLSDVERTILDQTMACSVTGEPDAVRAGLAAFIEQTGADEIMVTSSMFDHTARLRSFEIVAEVAISP